MLSEADILDLSEGGVFIATNEILPVGTQMILTLVIDSPESTKSCFLNGTVVWVGKHRKTGPKGCGVEFLNCPAATKVFMREFVAKQLGLTMEEAAEYVDKKPPGRGQLRG
jgi:uncharacterized protein (TIGR02266 family)